MDRSTPQASRPLKPTLATNRTAKTPLTPRLAGAPSMASTSISQTIRTVRNTNVSTPRVNATVREDTTPAKPYFSTNITPRSSSRLSRVGGDSASSTPNGTPNVTPTSSRPTSITDVAGCNGLGINGINGAQNGVRPRGMQAAPAPRSPMSNLYNHMPSDTSSVKDASNLFFHANDTRSYEQAPAQKKAPIFFYANGRQDEIVKKPEAPSATLSSTNRPSLEGKFFHADTMNEPKDRPAMPVYRPLSSSAELRLKTPPSNTLSPREQSPSRETIQPIVRKNSIQVARPMIPSRNSGSCTMPNSNTADLAGRPRRVSSVGPAYAGAGHGKRTSMSSIDAIVEPKTATLQDPSIFTPSPLHGINNMVVNDTTAESVSHAPSPPMTPYSGFSSPIPTSPGKAAGSKSALEMMNELAANARRERKVLDLEISNSSLLAINRSLEKEIRKQKAELRRFRRMSRAGRFSMDTVDTTETFDTNELEHAGELSDMSKEEVEPRPEGEDNESGDSSAEEGMLSPDAQAESDEAHRLGDEKRLQLDLLKHRELLVDSQKMNQSLKKCLNWTEQLIKDGQKALQYQVRVSDVKLGGRVLVAEDDHDISDMEESRGLLSPWSPLNQAMEALDSPFCNDPTCAADRDSGINLDTAETFPMNTAGEVHAHLANPFEERIKHIQESIDALEAC